MKTCPTLSFHLDDSLKKNFAISQLIDQVTADRLERESLSEETEVNKDTESVDEG